MDKVYLCIDLKSFYASVECADRGLDPFTTNLVVADPARTEKTICLAITPAMKALGIKNRCRVFQIPKGIDYIMARPRMQRYLDVSTKIYSIYLRYISPDDIHVYSVDECFIDATPYVRLYHTRAKDFAQKLMHDVFDETGICATAGIGTNLFLAKVALDVISKHTHDNIGILNEKTFQQRMWFHHPITDIWSIGNGIARRLAKHDIYDLAGIAACDPRIIMNEFGVNGEFLIDHAWGQEPCTIADIHAYTPSAHSISNGQVLPCDYSYDDAHTVMREMIEESLLDLHKKKLATRGVSLCIGYSKQAALSEYGTMFTHTSKQLAAPTSSRTYILQKFDEMYRKITFRGGKIRRVLTSLNSLDADTQMQMDIDGHHINERENNLQTAIASARHRFGKNAVMHAISLEKNATGMQRNLEIGGHHA